MKLSKHAWTIWGILLVVALVLMVLIPFSRTASWWIAAGCTVLMLALQGVVSLRWSTSFARYLYPVITHLPLVILLVAMTR